MSEDTTPRLGLPMIIGGQAQKHLTLNESLSRMDALVQARALSRSLASPPGSPASGDCYILPGSGTFSGAWAGFAAGDMIRFDNGLWAPVVTPEGMIVFISDEALCVVRHGGEWIRLSDTLSAIEGLGCLGIGASADDYNVMAVKGPGAWMSAIETGYGGSGDFRLTLNKEGTANTAEVLFQRGWVSRAIMGLRGDDEFSLSMSSDGVTFAEGLRLNAGGRATLMPFDRPGGDASSYAANTRFVNRALMRRRANGVQRRFLTARKWLCSMSPADNAWRSVCWSPELGLFAAVAVSGTGNRVMTSPDGVNWTARTSAADNEWFSVCWAPELRLFVATSLTGTGNRVMTSPDGITWTSRSSAADNSWASVCWSPELSLLVAVSVTGTGNRVMTSPDGITWTSRSSAADHNWRSVCWSADLGLFVAVAVSGSGNRVMTSPDGIHWTARSSAADNNWTCVCWSPELSLFVAVANTGTGNRVMTSPDGIHWTARSGASDNNWMSVCWAAELGLFAAVAMSGSGDRVMTSVDGINWTSRASASDNDWFLLCWSPGLGLFAAVASSGVGNRVMTSVQSTGVQSGLPRVGAAAVTTLSSDANVTLMPLIDGPDVRHTGALTAARTISLSTLNSYDGARFRITRTGSGAFGLSIGGLKDLSPNTWCEVVFGDGAWFLSQSGSL